MVEVAIRALAEDRTPTFDLLFHDELPEPLPSSSFLTSHEEKEVDDDVDSDAGGRRAAAAVRGGESDDWVLS